MCAINGFTFKDKEVIERMNFVTRHRGPDSTSIYVNEEVSLGHNRLSIIDVRHVADQPIVSDDGRYVLVFNGEIYNFKDLKEELTEYKFNTNSDTEVILKGFQKWGIGIFSKLNGMYALAIWDCYEKKLVLARDPQGIKPLYYKIENNNIIFSSEIKAILEHRFVERKLDLNALNIYLSNLYVPAPFTMFKGVSKLMPGTYMIFDSGVKKVGEIKYQSVEREGNLEKIIDKAMERQTISDRPIGVFLSGGIDSSIVLDSVLKKNKKIDTFSVSFDLNNKKEEDKFNFDSSTAKKTSALYGTNHHEINVGVKDVLDCLDDVIYHLDEPIANPTTVPTFILSKYAKSKVDVVLGGDGADEFFGGYDRYRLSLVCDLYQKIVPKIVRKKLSHFKYFDKLNTESLFERYKLFHFQNEKDLLGVLNKNYFNKYAEEFFSKEIDILGQKVSATECLMRADQRFWLVDESLMRSDKMTMSHSLEQRVPFLDLEVVNIASKISIYKKIGFYKNKKILRKIFRKRLPEYIFNQPKRGWFSPAAKWMRNEDFLKKMREVLSEDYYSETEKLFNWNKLHEVLDNHVSGVVYNRAILWAVFTFQIWAKRYQIKV